MTKRLARAGAILAAALAVATLGPAVALGAHRAAATHSISTATTSSRATGSVRACGRVGGHRITAYNLSCHRARSVWKRLPRGWGGGNADVAGGLAWVCRARDIDRVSRARRGTRFSLARLAGAPVVAAKVPYGD